MNLIIMWSGSFQIMDYDAYHGHLFNYGLFYIFSL